MGDAISDKKNAFRVAMKLNIRTDADILARLDAQENKQAYVKRLIRADIAAKSPDIDSYIDAAEAADE